MLETGVGAVRQALEAAQLPPFSIAGRELVSAAVGADRQWRGVAAAASAMGAITAYLALRFRPAFALGAIVATLHDVLVTLSCLALAGYDLTLNVSAALLTVIGYSVNDTIVVFDRVREQAGLGRALPLSAAIDLGISQTLSRTLVTAGTTLLSVLALYVFGGEALRGFAFTMLVGIVSGTCSTVFVAPALATVLSRRPPSSGRA
jgi:preprotein translocase subunit SecF